MGTQQPAVSADKHASLPPGPRGIPILGNALQMGGGEIIQRYMELWKQYGDLISMKLGPLNGYVLVNPEHVYHVLVKNQKNYIKGVGYDGFRLLVGQGLVTSDGELWRQQRRLMQPSFTPTAITQFAGMMVDVTRRMLDQWQVAAERGDVLCVDTEMTRLTMSIIGRAMFGIDLGDELSPVGAAFQEAFAFIPARSMNPLLPLALPLPAHRRFQRNLQTINTFIEQRIEEGRRNSSQDNLLAILLRARDAETGARMSAAQLRDEVVTLFFAGFETTARSLTWGWYLLAKHPEVVRRLEAEVDQQVGTRDPDVADLYHLEYTRMVVDETLRLYPPTALLARQNVEDDEIGGYRIPAGSMLILVPYLVHRHPSVWPEPERFDPQRFTAEAVAERPKHAYIPFAAGPRVCIGNNFALLEMVYAFAMASARFRLELESDADIPIEFVGTTRPTKPLLVNVRNRKQ